MKNNVRRESTKGLFREIQTLAEVIVLSVVYYIFWDQFYNETTMPLYLGKGKYLLMAVYAFFVYVFVKNIDGFRFGDLRRTDLGLAQWIGVIITNFITYFQLCLISNRMITPVPMLLLTVVDVVITTVFVYFYVFLYRSTYAPHKMIMVFGTEEALSLKIKIDSRLDKYNIKKMISADESLEKIQEEIVNYDAVVINDVPAQVRNDILKFCYKNQIRTYVVPKITDVILRGAKDVSVFDTPIFLVKGTGLTIAQKFFKRLMDIVICVVALIPAAPIMLIVALAIKLEDKGPVFYKQKRVTLGGKTFDILKFRSMIVDAEKAGVSIPATGDDPRITKVGKVIRAMRIDELPQILNILKGDMSIVGPRPERVEHVEEYTKEIPEFEYRLKVKGGLTGYAQIYGKYNTCAYDKLRMDLLYIEHYSLLLDIRLILTTIRIMFQKESTEGFEKAAEQQELIKECIEEMKNQD
ncbi:MAG: sugar transferase [Clostridia bacterium]|nr:sugar transferase [Clostridia bacterium]